MMSKVRLLCFAAAVAVMTASSSYGVHWVEVGDAPSGVPARQDTNGTGPLSRIEGNLIPNAGLMDTDTYSIIITDPASFLASTKTSFGGSAVSATGANLDTRLWLWTDNGTVLLGNDDVNSTSLGTDTLGSLISDPSTFPSLSGGELVNASAANVALQAGRKYLLSISLFANDPDDAAGVDLVNLGADFDALHGPNAAAGAFARWEDPTSTVTGTYTIALRGATYCVPEPTGLGMMGLGLSLLFAKRFFR
jgi:hypothetical protein